MTDSTDQLLTIAEMGATFAGFTAIVGVLASDARTRSATQLNFWIMMEFSFAAIVFSLLPIMLMNFDLESQTVWIASSSVMAAFIPLHVAIVGRLFIVPATKRGEFDPNAPYVFVPLFVLVLIVQVLNVLGIGFQGTYGAYFLGLAFFILLVFSNFAALLRQIWVSASEADA